MAGQVRRLEHLKMQCDDDGYWDSSNRYYDDPEKAQELITINEELAEEERQNDLRRRAPVLADCADEYADFAGTRESDENGVARLPTGLKSLDELTGGISGLTILAGDQGTGKTSLLLQAIVSALSANPTIAVVYCCTDTINARNVMDMMVSQVAKVDLASMLSGRLSTRQKAKVDEATQFLTETVWPRMRVVDQYSNYMKRTYDQAGHRGGLDAFRLELLVSNMLDRFDLEEIVLVIDVLQAMPVPGHRDASQRLPEWSDPEQYRIDQILTYRSKMKMKSSMAFPVVAVSEIRKQQGRGRTELHADDIMGGANLKYQADRIFLLEQDESSKAAGDYVGMTLRVAKARRGCRGTVSLRFKFSEHRFEESQTGTKVKKPATRSRKSKSLNTENDL